MSAKRALKIAGAALAVTVALVVAAGGWLKWSPRSVPSGQPALVTLDASSLPAFRSAFDEGQGQVRVLVLLSPT